MERVRSELERLSGCSIDLRERCRGLRRNLRLMNQLYDTLRNDHDRDIPTIVQRLMQLMARADASEV